MASSGELKKIESKVERVLGFPLNLEYPKIGWIWDRVVIQGVDTQLRAGFKIHIPCQFEDISEILEFSLITIFESFLLKKENSRSSSYAKKCVQRVLAFTMCALEFSKNYSFSNKIIF